MPPEPEWVPPKVATTSAACGVAQGDAVGAAHTTPSGRTYSVWGPPSYDPNKTYPVVMMFHGWQSTGPGFQGWFQQDKYVEGEAFVVYPSAINGLWDLNGNTDLVFFDEMVKQLGETYCINPSRILGFGFSYGGKFANHLGCKRAGYVKAISVGDGSWGGDGQKCGRLPVLVTHRTKDTDEIIAWGRDVAKAWTGLNQCAAASVTSSAEMNCVSQSACKNPGGVTFCEDTYAYPPEWNFPASYDHTVREPYRLYTWQWFKALP